MATTSSVNRRPLEVQVARTLTKFGMIRAGEHVLVAVSGGADSTALLLCLLQLAPALGIRLSAAHLNHCLRGEESESDDGLVRNVCKGLALSRLSEAIPVRPSGSAARASWSHHGR